MRTLREMTRRSALGRVSPGESKVDGDEDHYREEQEPPKSEKARSRIQSWLRGTYGSCATVFSQLQHGGRFRKEGAAPQSGAWVVQLRGQLSCHVFNLLVRLGPHRRGVPCLQDQVLQVWKKIKAHNVACLVPWHGS